MSEISPSSSDKVYVGVVGPVGVAAAAAPGVAAAGAGPQVEVVLLGAAEAEDAAEDVGEGVLEVAVRHHVNHRVQRRVEITDPEVRKKDDFFLEIFFPR